VNGKGKELAMRAQFVVLLLGALLVTACGTTRRTTVVTVPQGSTVVVPSSDGETRVVRP
jgi:uncharacterized lipoprotein YajG